MKPSLVHGDLWFANSGIDVGTDEPLVFDSCSFYAHNECKSILGSVPRAMAKLKSHLSKMSSVSGDPSVTDSEANTLKHITLMLKFHHRQRTTRAALIPINCESAIGIDYEVGLI